MDEEIIAEMDEFLDDALLQEFAHDQGLRVQWRIERLESGYRCVIELNGTAMPSVIASDDQTALDNASVQVIELLTRRDLKLEPELALS